MAHFPNSNDLTKDAQLQRKLTQDSIEWRKKNKPTQIKRGVTGFTPIKGSKKHIVIGRK